MRCLTFVTGKAFRLAVTGILQVTSIALALVVWLGADSIVVAQSSGPYMFVSSSQGHSIQRFDAQTGAFVDNFVPPGSGGLNSPQEIIFGPDGHVYITGFGNPRIKKYDRDSGQYLGDFTQNYTLRQPTKTIFHTDSLIYVSQWAGNEKVVRFRQDNGDFVDEFTSTGVVNGMGQAWDTEGNVYVVSWGTDGSNGNVQKFDATGAFQEIFIPTGRGGLSGPVNIWREGGEFFVVDWSIGRVLRFDSVTGAFNGTFISGLVRTEGFTFADDGSIFLCDWQLNRVNRYDSTGSFLGVFASVGMSRPNDVIFGPPPLPTSVAGLHGIVPENVALHQNFPNPFNPETSISYTLPGRSQVLLRIYNVRGELVRTLVDSDQTAGAKSVVWDGHDDLGQPSASGVYLYEIEAAGFTQVKRMVLLR